MPGPIANGREPAAWRRDFAVRIGGSTPRFRLPGETRRQRGGSTRSCITRRSTKLECTPETPSMRVMCCSSSRW